MFRFRAARPPRSSACRGNEWRQTVRRLRAPCSIGAVRSDEARCRAIGLSVPAISLCLLHAVFAEHTLTGRDDGFNLGGAKVLDDGDQRGGRRRRERRLPRGLDARKDVREVRRRDRARTLLADSLARAQVGKGGKCCLRRAARSELPALVLMMDDDRLPNPRATILALPRGSLVVLRARESERRRRVCARAGAVRALARP